MISGQEISFLSSLEGSIKLRVLLLLSPVLAMYVGLRQAPVTPTNGAAKFRHVTKVPDGNHEKYWERRRRDVARAWMWLTYERPNGLTDTDTDMQMSNNISGVEVHLIPTNTKYLLFCSDYDFTAVYLCLKTVYWNNIRQFTFEFIFLLFTQIYCIIIR